MGYGIDLGSSSVKVVAVRRALSGFKVLGAGRRRMPRAGQADPKAAVTRLVHEALGGSNGRRVGVVGLSGRDINLQLIQQPAMKPVNYRVMMNYELEQRQGQAGDSYLDYCTLREPDQYFPQYLALIGIGKSSYVDERIDTLARASVDVRDAVPNAFALYAVHKNAYGAEGGTVMLIDIGADNMDIAFVRGGRLVFARNVSSGARAFDANIAGAMGVGPDEAEALKIGYANLGPGAPVDDEESPEFRVRAPVRTAAGQLSGFISSSIHHAKVQLNDREFAVDKVYLSGGGARIRGLSEYLTGALKIPVEVLDPFRNVDVSGLGGPGSDDFLQTPSDMVVALGLAQLSAGGTEKSTLSILPAALKKRRGFFRTTFWLGVAASALAVTLLALTAVAFVRKGSQSAALREFTARTAQLSARVREMDALEKEQRDASAKLDLLTSHLSGARGAMDAVSKLRRVLPPGVAIKELRLVDPAWQRESRGSHRDDPDRHRAYFIVRGKGLVSGEIESEVGDQIKLKGVAEPYAAAEVVGGVVRVPSASRALLVGGEVDENIRGGPREALNAVRDQLTDPLRGVAARILRVNASPDKPGWRVFEILVTFE